MPNLEIIIRYCSVLRHEIKQQEMVLRIQKGNTRNWFKNFFFLKPIVTSFIFVSMSASLFFVIVSASILFLFPTIYYSVVLIP